MKIRLEIFLLVYRSVQLLTNTSFKYQININLDMDTPSENINTAKFRIPIRKNKNMQDA